MEASQPTLALALVLAGLGCSSTTAVDDTTDLDSGRADGDATTTAPDTGSDATSAPDTANDATSAPDTANDAASALDTGNDGESAPDVAAMGAIRWIGRFDLTNPAQPTAEWSASAMEARFSGTSVSVHLGGANNYFAAVVDGVEEPVVTTGGGSTYPIATGLEAGIHDVLVVRRDEAFDQPSQLVGFDFGSGGQLLPPPPAAAHRLEVIGDSISAGYGDECTNASMHFSATTENAYLAYGPLTARALGADIHLIAWSGKGMYRNNDGTTTDTMPILWQRTLPTDMTSQWDPSTWIPDAVVINLGTNDYAAQGDPTASYQAAYLSFVTQLRGAYPGAFIFCALGPMMSGTNLNSARTAVNNVIAMRATAGDANLKLVEFATQNCMADGSGCGCDYHPNLAEHQAMATVLEGAIHDTLGW
jgi:lysophospholipase L1-like esterase